MKKKMFFFFRRVISHAVIGYRVCMGTSSFLQREWNERHGGGRGVFVTSYSGSPSPFYYAKENSTRFTFKNFTLCNTNIYIWVTRPRWRSFRESLAFSPLLNCNQRRRRGERYRRKYVKVLAPDAQTTAGVEQTVVRKINFCNSNLQQFIRQPQISSDGMRAWPQRAETCRADNLFQ